jgi:hypothetical protein
MEVDGWLVIRGFAGSAGSVIRPKLHVRRASVICVDQLVVANPLAMVVADDSLKDSAIGRCLLGGFPQAANVAFNRRLSMAPDSL